jgi:hypothetical protein
MPNTPELMENLSVFVKVHLAEIIFSVAGVVGSIIVFYLLKKKPEVLGFKQKPAPVAYLLGLAPLILVVIGFFQGTASGLSYPTGIIIHRNTIVVEGIVRTTRQSTANEDIEEVEEFSRTMLFDKTTGKEIASLSGFNPMYCAGSMMLVSANFGYNIVDLSTGKVVNIMSEDDIKTRAGALAGEKIYSIELKKGEAAFGVRTVKDKNFVYDPVLEKDESSETYTPFPDGRSRNEVFKSKTVDLFLAEELGSTKNGTTLVLSYDDLEKKAFLISAISSEGKLLWTRRDVEISPKLEGQPFTIDASARNTILDEQNFYFVNNYYLVCVSLASGELKWIMPI